MKRVLIFALKSVCYSSYLYFADSLAKSLQQAGVAVEMFSAKNGPLEAMEQYVGKAFDAVFDFNSELPRLTMDDGSYFLDQIHAPFYNIILDHPLYHHDTLKQTISNFHVLCLDECHRRYIKEHYPHIASAHLFLMTGEDIAGTDGYPKKEIDVFFSGTYTDWRKVEESIQTCPAFLEKVTKQLISLVQGNPAMTQEEALTRLLPSLEEEEIIRETFPLHMQACFLCDTYLRAFKREDLLLSLAKSHVPLTLCGNGWRSSPLAEFPQIQIIDDTDFKDMFSYFRKSKITLNLMPEFKCGAHDRIYSAMLNHSLCMTDATPLLKEQFSDWQDVIFYEYSDRNRLPEQIMELLNSKSRLIKLSENGYRKAKKSHSWQARAALLIEICHLN